MLVLILNVASIILYDQLKGLSHSIVTKTVGTFSTQLRLFGDRELLHSINIINISLFLSQIVLKAACNSMLYLDTSDSLTTHGFMGVLQI